MLVVDEADNTPETQLVCLPTARHESRCDQFYARSIYEADCLAREAGLESLGTNSRYQYTSEAKRNFRTSISCGLSQNTPRVTLGILFRAERG